MGADVEVEGLGVRTAEVDAVDYISHGHSQNSRVLCYMWQMRSLARRV